MFYLKRSLRFFIAAHILPKNVTEAEQHVCVGIFAVA